MVWSAWNCGSVWLIRLSSKAMLTEESPAFPIQLSGRGSRVVGLGPRQANTCPQVTFGVRESVAWPIGDQGPVFQTKAEGNPATTIPLVSWNRFLPSVSNRAGNRPGRNSEAKPGHESGMVSGRVHAQHDFCREIVHEVDPNDRWLDQAPGNSVGSSCTARVSDAM